MNNELMNSHDYTILHDHQQLLRNSQSEVEDYSNVTDQAQYPTYVNATALNKVEVRKTLNNDYNVLNRGNFKVRDRDLTETYDHLDLRVKKRSTRPYITYFISMAFVLAGFLVLFFVVFVATTAVLYSRVSNLIKSGSEGELQELLDLVSGLKTSMQTLNSSLQSQISMMSESHNDLEVVNKITEMIGYMEIVPAPSCRVIILLNPTSPSGYYWVRSVNNSSVLVYCDMTFSCSGRANVGWMRVAYTQINETVECPRGFIKDRNNENLCIRHEVKPGCTSIEYPINMMYSKICGAVQGQGFKSVDGFVLYGTPREGINGSYLDGISITRGNTSRKHVWSFPVTAYCRCNSSVPDFVGADYSCLKYRNCDDNNPTWFLKTLTQASSDSVEVTVCRDQERGDEDVGIESIQLYIQ